jgi:hypothetical protein
LQSGLVLYLATLSAPALPEKILFFLVLLVTDKIIFLNHFYLLLAVFSCSSMPDPAWAPLPPVSKNKNDILLSFLKIFFLLFTFS